MPWLLRSRSRNARPTPQCNAKRISVFLYDSRKRMQEGILIGRKYFAYQTAFCLTTLVPMPPIMAPREAGPQ